MKFMMCIKDFSPVIVSDAVSSSDKDVHIGSLKNMPRFLKVVITNEVVNVWSR